MCSCRHPRRPSDRFSILRFALGCALGWGLISTLLAGAMAFAQPSAVSDAELEDLEAAATQSYIEDDLETAAALYRQLADLHPDQDKRTRLLMTVAAIEHDLGDTDRAVSTLAEILTVDPDYELQRELYSESFVPLFYDAKERAAENLAAQSTGLVAQGISHLATGDPSEARRLFQEALAARSDHPEALYNLALLDLREGRDDTAMAGFQKVVALAESQPDLVADDTLSRALTNAGLLFLRRGGASDAAGALQRAVELDDSNAAAWSNLGIALRSTGRNAEAARAFSRAVDRDPDDPGHLANLAVAYLDAGDAESARKLLDEATGRFPRRADLWLHLGTVYRKLDRNEDAATALEAALRNDPENELKVGQQAAVELALVHYRLGHAEATVEAAERALGWRPDSVNALIYRALAEIKMGRLDAARDDLERARELAPRSAIVHLNLGNVLYGLDDWDGAEKTFEKALELDPNLTTARTNLDDLRDARRRGAVPASRTGNESTRSPVAPSRRQTSDDSRTAKQESTSRSTSGVRSAEDRTGRQVDVGIVFSDVDYSSLGLEGAMVERVRPGSVAARAGLRSGDLLLRLDGRKLADIRDFTSRLGQTSPGSRVQIDLLRDNRPLQIELPVP